MPASSVLDAVKASLRGRSSLSLDVLTAFLADAEQARDRIIDDVGTLVDELAESMLEPDVARTKIRVSPAAARDRLTDAEDLVASLTMRRDAAVHTAAEERRTTKALG